MHPTQITSRVEEMVDVDRLGAYDASGENDEDFFEDMYD